jgi:hypothetical protein
VPNQNNLQATIFNHSLGDLKGINDQNTWTY